MPYEIVWHKDAEADLDRIASHDPVAASQIIDQIEALGNDPVGLSRPPSFPHLLYPKYTFKVPTERGRAYVVALFRYLLDEQTIQVMGIAFSELED